MADAGWAQIAHTRMIGNRLRELDRFLAVLIEDVAAVGGQPGHDRERFSRLRSTPRKLRVVEEMFATGADDDARLRAIGRLTACLHHCKGRIHTASIHDDILTARGSAKGPAWQQKEALLIDAQTLLAICAFYRGIGDRLLALAQIPRIHGADLDFLARRHQNLGANVAYDGI